MGIMTRREVLGDGTFGLRPPGYVSSRVLAANVAETITVPTDITGKAMLVVFSATADFFAAYDAVAVVPVDTDDGSSNELNPTQRIVSKNSTISVISSTTCTVTASFWS